MLKTVSRIQRRNLNDKIENSSPSTPYAPPNLLPQKNIATPCHH